MTRRELLATVPEGFTPGPWNLSADRESITQTSHITRDVWTIPRTVDDMSLIALAPDLLAALREADAQVDTLTRERDEALAAAEAAHKAAFDYAATYIEGTDIPIPLSVAQGSKRELLRYFAIKLAGEVRNLRGAAMRAAKVTP